MGNDLHDRGRKEFWNVRCRSYNDRSKMSTPSRTPRSAGRPRAFDVQAVVNAARDGFSEHGPELTSIVDLERCTGLDRSSLYNAFGTKQGLFEAALRSYLEGIESRLNPLRQPEAGLKTVTAFFVGMAQTLRADPTMAARGCLMVNAVAELGALDPRTTLAGSYRDAFRSAFLTALRQAAARGEISKSRVPARAKLLASLVMGLFVTARIDPIDAAEVCQDVAAEVRSWGAS
jgi:TetR/AcrR family transcriptional regulator, transcriptional repressor for nem operon